MIPKIDIITKIQKELERNDNKISSQFIDDLAERSTPHHAKVGEFTRICVITLPSGHEVVGYAQVLDRNNDVKEVGEKVAYDNAKKEIWRVVGAIAKALM